MMEERRVGIDAYLDTNNQSINEVKHVNVPKSKPTEQTCSSQVQMKIEPMQSHDPTL